MPGDGVAGPALDLADHGVGGLYVSYDASTAGGASVAGLLVLVYMSVRLVRS